MSRYIEFEDYNRSHATGTYRFPGPLPGASEYYPAARVQVPVPGRSRNTSRPAYRRTILRPSPVPGMFCCDDLGCYSRGVPVSFENPTSKQFGDVNGDHLYTPNASSRSCLACQSDRFDSPSRARTFLSSMPLGATQFQPSLENDPYFHIPNVHRRSPVAEILTAHRLAPRGGVLVGDGDGLYRNRNPYSPYSLYSVDSSRGRDVY
jgi:hypothetical protein